MYICTFSRVPQRQKMCISHFDYHILALLVQMADTFFEVGEPEMVSVFYFIPTLNTHCS